MSEANPSLSSTQGLVRQLREEATEVARLSGQALISLAWVWPIRGLFYTIIRR